MRGAFVKCYLKLVVSDPGCEIHLVRACCHFEIKIKNINCKNLNISIWYFMFYITKNRDNESMHSKTMNSYRILNIKFDYTVIYQFKYKN